jgi:pimeloyl-ACP methyl ester carboxylesterase/DNA-binding CsgD family transcriptional regulator
MLDIPFLRSVHRFASSGQPRGRIRPFRWATLPGVEGQTIRFTTEGGRRIAWAQHGSGPPLVCSGWWMSHLELNWRGARFRDWNEALGRYRTVIRYDMPGTGLSADGNALDAGLDEEAAAMAAVVEAAVGEEPVDLFAGSSGAPIGLAYAAAHPDRVRRLLLCGGYASGAEIADERTRVAIVNLTREHWGLGSRALADVFIPSATPAEREEFVEFQRQAASADRAATSLEAVYTFDAADRLGGVTAPTTILHRREDRAIPFDLGRRLAAAIPGADLVALDGADHFPWFGDSDQVFAALLEGLGVEERPPPLPRYDAAPEAPAGPVGAGELTRRETEVLTLIAKGLSDREIAERLVLSPHTIHRHVANVRTKLGLPSRAAAVAEASRRGLI